MEVTINLYVLGLVCLALSPLIIVNALLVTWGSLDLYAMMRFRRHHKIDKTAIMGNWISLKWIFVTRVDEIADNLPFVTQDLTEVLGIKVDDGKVS